MSGARHAIPIPRGARLLVAPGSEVRADHELARRRAPLPPVAVQVASRLRRPPAEAARLCLVAAGERLSAGDLLALGPRGRVVRSPVDGIFLGCSSADGAALIAPLGEEQPIVGHVRGRVAAIDDEAISIDVPAARIVGVDGTGDAVHGELVVSVRDPEEELRAGQIDVGATGKILVGGSRASAETMTRARAMGVSGIVLGGVLDKELRDFVAIQRRRQALGGITGSFSLLLVEGYGKVALDPGLFAWFRRHAGREASLFGRDRILYVYDAGPPPARRILPRVGDRVIAHRRPFQGRGGRLEAVLEELHATTSGIPTPTGLVRFEDGQLTPVPLANLEATEDDVPPPSDGA